MVLDDNLLQLLEKQLKQAKESKNDICSITIAP
jgi:hypothetical protein